MEINFRMQVRGGPRTSLVVEVARTGNPKIITFANGRTVSDAKIIDWVQAELAKALAAIEQMPPKDAGR